MDWKGTRPVRAVGVIPKTQILFTATMSQSPASATPGLNRQDPPIPTMRIRGV